MVYQSSWENIVNSEIFRQRDKSNNNDIGYFHQRIFEYINHCTVPEDTVLKELTKISTYFGEKSRELSMAMAVYFLGFGSYSGFQNYLNYENGKKEIFLNELYEYGKKK